jgi:hypothetical protein
MVDFPEQALTVLNDFYFRVGQVVVGNGSLETISLRSNIARRLLSVSSVGMNSRLGDTTDQMLQISYSK